MRQRLKNKPNKMVQITCATDLSCPYQHYCDTINNRCLHEPTFPISGYPIAIYCLFPIASAICNTTGNSFGSFKVILLMLALNYSESSATIISYPLVTGTALYNFFALMFRRHPVKQTTLVDYNIVMIIVPNAVFGSTIGTLLNDILPPIVANILITILLTLFSIKFFCKLKALIEQEKDKEQEEQQEERLARDRDPRETQQGLVFDVFMKQVIKDSVYPLQTHLPIRNNAVISHEKHMSPTKGRGPREAQQGVVFDVFMKQPSQSQIMKDSVQPLQTLSPIRNNEEKHMSPTKDRGPREAQQGVVFDVFMKQPSQSQIMKDSVQPLQTLSPIRNNEEKHMSPTKDRGPREAQQGVVFDVFMKQPSQSQIMKDSVQPLQTLSPIRNNAGNNEENIVSPPTDRGPYSQQLNAKIQYEKSLHFPQIIAILCIFAVFAVAALLAQGKLVQFSNCSKYYGIGMGTLAIFYFVALLLLKFYFNNRMEHFRTIGYDYPYPLDTWKYFGIICIGAFFGGFNSGLFSNGNSTTIIFSLVFLQIEPIVVSAIVGFQVIFSAAVSLILAYSKGQLNSAQIGFFIGVTFVAGGLFSFLVSKFIKTLKKQTVNKIILLIVGCLSCSSAIGMIISTGISYKLFGSQYMNSPAQFCKN